ncbi:MAG: sigma 54-dependent Fis family transcriptional regulator [Polyangiaceae bacterium]|nr:sigma 54-dependent Fis family transcriptional regulator [Polyangiaceae bacterium]MCB9609523.1 sigma 54-dependent Fis family transcriptional regulator [Polyangiaceae bacterium]
MGSELTIDLAEALSSRGVRMKLVVLDGPDAGAECALDAEVIVGADAGANLVLGDAAVSRRHASFTCSGGRVFVRDLQSRNGTFLGATRIGEAEVTLGAVLRLGGTTLSIQPRLQVREVQPATSRRFGRLVGESVAMREIFSVLERVADTDVTLLVEGESGTGKELVAQSVHEASSRSSTPIVTFDCGAVPVNLAETELFGHKRGAFSGALADRIGAFEQADGGTIFLDEIGELPLDLQPRLLRVLETGEIRRVGENNMRRVNVRVIAATNRDLHAEVRRGNFRGDLLYRLEVIRLRIPPLRHRPEDIPGLVQVLLDGKVSDSELGGENLRLLQGYAWPGNVRELRNVLTRALALASSARPAFADLLINLGPAASSPAHLGIQFPGVASHLPYREAKSQLLESFDRAYLDALLQRYPDNHSKAASAAGLSRKHLYELLKRAGEGGDPPDED